MSTNLIAHLKKKCEADDNVKILLSQWEFDQKLVGKALENIGGFYPHFSNHNASHSQQILVNIERILGDDIHLLSATDTWLILEAAYWHDAGMLVDAEKAKKVHNEENFKKMLREIVQNKSSDLYEFAKVFLNESWQDAIALEEHPFDGVEKYRQLIAEYFRKEHANRIGDIVLEDYKNLGINTPRTELLPTRLFRYLGSICVGHGMNFDKMMEVLPKCQRGLGTEDCHPLFVACLLRLGDLFDLDDNRFCPVMAKHVSNMPSVSKHHHDKHLSLREFQLDKRTVKLVAECPDEMSYVETQNWFGWIREEFQNQMSQWNLIVPNSKFGSLPTIEQLDVRMEVKYENGVKKEKLLLNNKPMKFKLDEKNAMELLQGANLYSDEYSIYRELIQNSIDATMLRIWLEEDQEKLKELHPYHEDFLKILEKYPLRLEINKVKNIEGSLDSIWEFQIIDQGIGMSMVDLGYMQTMAGSSKNAHKKKIINEMPQWMRPSGEFGIGLHSAFLLTKDLPMEFQNIRFETCSYFTHDSLDIEMSSPLGGKQGYCFITKKIGYTRKTGTTIKLYIKVNFDLGKIHDNEKLNFLNIESFEKKWGTYEKEKIYEEILKNAPICTLGFSKKIVSDVIWDKEKQIAFYLKPNIKITSIRREVLFKGQAVGINDYRGYPLSNCHNYDYMIDIYGISAKKILNISRDYWNINFEYTHGELLMELYKKFLRCKAGKENDVLRLIYGESHRFEEFTTHEWVDYSIGGYRIKDILENSSFYILNIGSHEKNYEKKKKSLRELFFDYIIIEPKNDSEDIFVEALNKFCQINSYFIYDLRNKESNIQYHEHIGVSFYNKDNSHPKGVGENLYWDKNESINFNENKEENVFSFLWNSLYRSESEQSGYLNIEYIGRNYNNKSNCLDDFEILFIYQGNEPWRVEEILSPYQNINGVIDLLDLDHLSRYVANRKDDLINLERYKDAYRKLVLEIDKYK
ncbi:histidine kinase [Acinetobacter wuhouensis]|uniref:HD domain-containing protein n=1 Tax=Acinetobacter wuhouensis TaxID=1879050 RepID=UPI0010233B08|nr:histidine kinase [Acinetobacter wuhouensis]RZG72748.1 histidine kinase [Acinetobacter wuhouensis]